MNMTRDRFILLLASLLILVFGIAIINSIQKAGTGTLELQTLPASTTVTIDNSTRSKPGTIRLSPGDHTITISQKGYTTGSFGVKIVAHRSVTKKYALTAAPSASSTNHAATTEEEGITGSTANAQGRDTTANNPLIAQLPHIGSDYRIDFGASQQHPNDPKYVAIYITPYINGGKDEAIAWIQNQGYNPDAYEIIYKDAQ
jgi:hypothetical protein